MEDETLNEEQIVPETDQPETATPAEESAPAETTPEVPEAPAEEPTPAVEAPKVEAPVPAPAPATAPAKPVVVPQPSAQVAVDPMAPADTSKSVELAMTEDARKQKAFFESQPKVMMNLPLKDGERAGAYESVCVNGYRLQIQKGVVVSLPQGVAEILAEHYNIQLGTGAIPEEAHVRVDRDEKTETALA